MRFAVVLVAALYVAAVAHAFDPDLLDDEDILSVDDDDEGGRGGGRGGGGRGGGRNRGGYLCNLIAVQNPEVDVGECRAVRREIRSYCLDELLDGERPRNRQQRRNVRSCVVEGLEERFEFDSLRELDAEPRAELISRACSRRRNQDADSCEARFNGLVEACSKVADYSPKDNQIFRRCTRPIRRSFRRRGGNNRNRNRNRRRNNRNRNRRRNRNRKDEGEASSEEDLLEMEE